MARRYMVVKLSGSLVYPPSPDYLRSLRSAVISLVNEGWGLGVVVGGGPVARNVIMALRAIGVPESLLDEVGIEAANLNALVVAIALSPLSSPEIATDVKKAVVMSREGMIPVMGGLQPGQSTNSVAAVLAEALQAELLVNLLNGVDGVYTGKPGEEGSRRLDVLTYDQLEAIVVGKSQSAGSYELFDHVALGIVRRSRLKLVFADGRDPQVLISISKGEKVGSWVTP